MYSCWNLPVICVISFLLRIDLTLMNLPIMGNEFYQYALSDMLAVQIECKNDNSFLGVIQLGDLVEITIFSDANVLICF